MLALEEVESFYGAIQALHGVSLEVREGEIATLIGSNGAGKSTLLMTVCGVVRARRGRVLLDGEDVTRRPTSAIVRSGVAISPEGRRVFPRMTVRENLLLGSGPGADPARAAERVEEAFELFPRLRERASQRGGTLSGGEQQMLAIGRAMASSPRLLLLDEPSLGLAPILVRQIFAAVRDINERRGTTVLLVEQNAHHALRLAHRGYVMVTGRIEASGTGEELLRSPEVRAAYLEGGGRRAAGGAAPAGGGGPAEGGGA